MEGEKGGVGGMSSRNFFVSGVNVCLQKTLKEKGYYLERS